MVVAALSLLPILLAPMPPLHDYPFHIARAAILADLPASTFLQSVYARGSMLLPNVGMDAAMLPLMAVFPVETAGRVLLGLILLLTLSGTMALHAALHPGEAGQRRLWPLLAGFVLFNFVFFLGFVSYLLGMALALWAMALWVRMPTGWLRVAGGTAAAIVLLFCHLSALGLFAVVVAGLEIDRAMRSWRASRSAALAWLAAGTVPFLVAAALLLALSPAAGEAGRPAEYMAGLSWKPVMAMRMVMTPIPWLDAMTLLPLVAALAWLGWQRRIQVARPMGLALGLLGCAYLVLPFSLFGSDWGDARLVPAIVFVGIAATSVRLPTGRIGQALVVGAALLLCVRTLGVAAEFHTAQQQLAAMRAAFAALPDQTRLFVATAGFHPRVRERDDAQLDRWRPPFKHVVSYAAIGRDVFVPATWADPTKQPIHVTPGGAAAKALQTDNPLPLREPGAFAALLANIAATRPEGAGPSDHLLLLAPERLTENLPPGVVVLAGSADFLLLRLP